MMAELDLTYRIQRVRILDPGDLAVVSPLVAEGEKSAIERAFDLARSRRARLALVCEDERFRAPVERAAEPYEPVSFEPLSLAEAVPLLVHEPERFCVVLTEAPFTEAFSDMAAFNKDSSRIVASGRLSHDGRGVFGPTHGSAPDIAGQGVANPSGILLAAALMLSEGLGQRAAGRTLERAVSQALANGWRAPDVAGRRAAASTRDFMNAVLELMPSTRTDLEYTLEPA